MPPGPPCFCFCSPPPSSPFRLPDPPLTERSKTHSQGEQVTATDGVVLWRRMRDRKVPDAFLAQGGAEKAPMSTTHDLEVAVRHPRTVPKGAGEATRGGVGSACPLCGFDRGPATELPIPCTPTRLPTWFWQVRYSTSACSVLLKLVTESFRERGADLRWVSAFPAEVECCFPPLTHLRPIWAPREIQLGQGVLFTVLEVKPSFG